jgi:hypothetical protein
LGGGFIRGGFWFIPTAAPGFWPSGSFSPALLCRRPADLEVGNLKLEVGINAPWARNGLRVIMKYIFCEKPDNDIILILIDNAEYRFSITEAKEFIELMTREVYGRSYGSLLGELAVTRNALGGVRDVIDEFYGG